MKFTKLVKAEEHYIPTALLDALVDTAEKTAKFARDMKNAGVKLDDETQAKIKAAMDVISEKFDEIRNSII